MSIRKPAADHEAVVKRLQRERDDLKTLQAASDYMNRQQLNDISSLKTEVEKFKLETSDLKTQVKGLEVDKEHLEITVEGLEEENAAFRE